jgi:hypothetical protein
VVGRKPPVIADLGRQGGTTDRQQPTGSSHLPLNPTVNSAGGGNRTRARWFRDPGTDGTASEFPAKGAGNPWQSRLSPEFQLFHSSVEKPVEIYPQFTPQTRKY